MADLVMPRARDFGWALKPASSTGFEIDRRPNGQFTVILAHALLRGVTAEMLHWWFLNFTGLRVTLRNVPGYDGAAVPAYLLWHPSDHVDARLSGPRGPGGTARAGSRILIQEAMQYETHGLKYPVNAELSVLYCAGDGWSMGKVLPLLGPAMVLAIRYRDVVESGVHVGVQYHYEIVVGLSGQGPVARAINRKITSAYTPEFFAAWHLHNTIEVGTFENFLPALHAGRTAAGSLTYAPEMDDAASGEAQSVHDPAFFEARAKGMREAADPYAFQDSRASAAF